MPIFASNFTSNSLSGAVFVSGGNVAVTLTPAAQALEGDKSFVIKIRRGSTQGTVLSTSAPITIRDRTSFVSLTANVSTVAEGNLVSFTVTTANVRDGATLYYSVLPVTSNITSSDFVANTGSFAVISNSGTFALKANADLSLMDESGETFKVQLRTNEVTGNIVYVASNILILDTSKQFTYSSLFQNNANVVSGGPTDGVPIRFTLTTINAAGANLYYSMTGNADQSLFITANTGYFIVPANNLSTFSFTGNTIASGIERDFQVVIKEEITGPTKITSSTYKALGYVTPKPSSVWTMVVAGGANGNPGNGAGGGAGGVAAGNVSITPGSPYTITIGGTATNSSAFGVTALAGGTQGVGGGSGGGGGVNGSASAGPGNQPSQSQPAGITNYGNPGGAKTVPGGNGGGGGAGGSGGVGDNNSFGRPGGGGIAFPSLDMGPAYQAVSYGGAGYLYNFPSPPTSVPSASYGSGGNAGAAGAGQGITIVSYPTAFQAAAANVGGTYSSSNGKHYYVYTTSGSITF